MMEPLAPLMDDPLLLPSLDCVNFTDTTNNGSQGCLEHAPILTDAAYTRAIVLGVMALVSLIGNLLTIYSIRTSRWGTYHCHFCLFTIPQSSTSQNMSCLK